VGKKYDPRWIPETVEADGRRVLVRTASNQLLVGEIETEDVEPFN
jgi:hypothetical protein